MHPDDERYRHLHRPHAIAAASSAAASRSSPTTAVEPAFGTGVVKVTPAHDPDDFEHRRAGTACRAIQVIDRSGRMTAAAGESFAGLDRVDARASWWSRSCASGRCWCKVEEHEHNVGHSQRGGEPIEPLVSTQWFCDVEAMAEQALEAVRDGRPARSCRRAG